MSLAIMDWEEVMMPPAYFAGLPHADRVAATVHESEAAARSVVAASWRRSMVYHRLDPSQRRSPNRVEARELKQAREQNGTLMEIASPSLRRLFATAGSAGCCVILADRKGLILEANTTPGDEKDFLDWGLSDGAVWSEAGEGTNGIGTCAAERRPVIIHQDQHFRAQNIAMSCMGAPIFDHTGDLAAVLDVSSCRRDMTQAFAQVLGHVVTESARSVERDLFRAAYSDARIVFAGDHDSNGVSLLAIDQDDLVIGATRQARKSLGLTDEILRLSPPICDYVDSLPPSKKLAGAEKAEIKRALARNRSNVSAAARDLGISRATIYRKISQHRIIV